MDAPTLVLGPASRDRWPADDLVLPGGGALNVAYHWRSRGRRSELITRVGTDGGDVVVDFVERHRIVTEPPLVVDGATAEIVVEVAGDRQPIMEDFAPGVWHDFRASPNEIRRLTESLATHLVMVDAVLDEVERWQAGGSADAMRLTADFLAMRHVPIDRFARIAPALDVAFTGWPGAPDDGAVADLVAAARAAGTVLVVTFGSSGVRVVDGDADRWFDVDARPVLGTTTGCGDAFIAGFLDAWLDGADLPGAVAAGAALGAEATAWPHALPPDAY